MRKVKNALLILLAVILVAAGGLLPMGAAFVQDKTTAGVVQYEDIEALQLKLEEEAPSMSYQEKMFLMMNGTGVEITDENTVIKEKEVLDVTHKAMTPYLELFFGKGLDNDYLEYYPVMVYDETDPSRFCYYWHVFLSVDESLADSTSVFLDDETGKILAIEMIDHEMYIEPPYLQELQYALTALYFGELGIQPVAEWPVAMANTEQNEAVSIVASCYQFIDALYGEVNVEIGVRTNGYYIYIV